MVEKKDHHRIHPLRHRSTFFYWPFHRHVFHAISFIYDMTLVKPLYTNGWYLQYLLIMYITFYIVKAFQKIHGNPIMIFSIISIVLFLTQREIKAEQSLSFLCGMVLSEFKEQSNKWSSVLSGLALVALGIVFLVMKQLPVVRTAPQIVMNIVQLLIKFPCGLGIIILLHRLSLLKTLQTILIFTGGISYELYLIHGYTLGYVSVNMLGAVLFILTTIVLSWFFIFFLQKQNQPLINY